MLLRVLFVFGLLVPVASCTGPLNAETLADKPTGYLCRLLSPDYITLPSEQEAIYRELDRRGTQCVATQRIIIN